MKLRATIEFEIAECDPNGADEEGFERLETMAADRVRDLVQLGFMNLFGAIESDNGLFIDNLMFEGEDHLLVIRNTEVKNVNVISADE